MLWLLLVLSLAFSVSILRGGRLANLADLRLRWWWMLPFAFGLQIAAELLPRADWSHRTAVSLLLLSYLPLLGVVIINRESAGMWLAGLGVLMNFTVISLNGGMPVLTEAAVVASGFSELEPIAGTKHVVIEQGVIMPFLADVIPIRVWIWGQVISLGDVFLAVGLGWFLESQLRKPVRWFKHRGNSPAGSARRPS